MLYGSTAVVLIEVLLGSNPRDAPLSKALLALIDYKKFFASRRDQQRGEEQGDHSWHRHRHRPLALRHQVSELPSCERQID